MWLNQKQKDIAVLPKPNLIVYIGRSQKMFLNLTLTPEIASKGPKKSHKTKKPKNQKQIMAELKTKNWVVFSHNQACKSSLF